MESFVVEALQHLFNEPQLIQGAIADYRVRQEKEQRQKLQGPSVKTLRQQLEKAKVRERALAEAVIDARLAGRDGSAFIGLQSDAEIVRQNLEKRIEALEKDSEPVDSEVSIPSLPSQNEFFRALANENVPVEKKAALLRRLITRIYPVRFSDTNIPSEQQPRTSGKYWATKTLAGVKIVLSTPREFGEEGPLCVLSYVAKERFSVPTANNSRWETIYGATLTLHQEDPFPALPKHCRATNAERQKLE